MAPEQAFILQDAAPHPLPPVSMASKGCPVIQADADELGPPNLGSVNSNHSLVLSNKMFPDSPIEMALTRASSVYSSTSSQDTLSTETTISQIVEMYTDLISKIPYSDEDPKDIPIIHPRAYRDTVAPLLIRHFSDETAPLMPTTTPPLPPLQHRQASRKYSESSLHSSYKQAPRFQEFSRNLKDRRAELVSPLSAISREDRKSASIDSVSLPSPADQTRPFSWIDDSMNVTWGIDRREVSLSSSTVQMDDSEAMLVTQGGAQEAQPNPKEAGTPPPRIPMLRHRTQSSTLLNDRQPSKSEKALSSLPTMFRQPTSNRYYRKHSTASDSSDSFVLYTGVGETVKAMIKQKMKQRREAKERADIMETAGQKYPGMKEHQQGDNKQPAARRNSSLKNGLGFVVQRLSTTGMSTEDFMTPPPRRRERQAAIPLTPYQQYGLEVWSAKNKKKRKQERQRERDEMLSNERQTPPRPKTHDGSQPRPVRSASTKTTTTIDPSAHHAKKHSLMAVLDGARHSFTQSSADKRREKLKESIVIVGPTRLTVANAQAGGTS